MDIKTDITRGSDVVRFLYRFFQVTGIIQYCLAIGKKLLGLVAVDFLDMAAMEFDGFG